MNQGFYKPYAGTLQFLFLAALYAIPQATELRIQPVALDSLTSILELEAGVILYGGLAVGVFFAPIALVDSRHLRRISLGLILLLGLPMTGRYLGEYGWHGLFMFTWLCFVTYGGVFLTGIDFNRRRTILVEIGLRWLFYFIFFALLTVLIKGSSNLYYWRDAGTVLWFGLIYFSVSALLEYKRYFPRAANITLHILTDRYALRPKSRIRYRKGKIRAYLLKRSNVHQWPVLLFSGAAVTAISSAVLFSTFNMESWVGIIASWAFMLPLLLLGLAFLLTAPVYAYWAVRAGPVLLYVGRHELQELDSLLAQGFIPRYSNKEERENVLAGLVCYRVDQVDQDIISVDKPVDYPIPEQDFQFRTTDDGTHFRVECRIPLSGARSPATGESNAGYIWQLQLEITETVHRGNEKINSYQWRAAFPLPVHP